MYNGDACTFIIGSLPRGLNLCIMQNAESYNIHIFEKKKYGWLMMNKQVSCLQSYFCSSVDSWQ